MRVIFYFDDMVSLGNLIRWQQLVSSVECEFSCLVLIRIWITNLKAPISSLISFSIKSINTLELSLIREINFYILQSLGHKKGTLKSASDHSAKNSD
ncbi:hypothetical protein KT99_00310 [Shewanella benthica KT99]|uniref:Uncharacterized protein n=1 Tax=Shewanella benthica KT99 TaxID=314608 RepID=A9DP32_9GAMM|nr:hypothetical protein KT99_00310 [Shewanella benthica KT99]